MPVGTVVKSKPVGTFVTDSEEADDTVFFRTLKGLPTLPAVVRLYPEDKGFETAETSLELQNAVQKCLAWSKGPVFIEWGRFD